MTAIPPPIIAGLIAALVTSCGIGIIHRFRDWGERNTTYFSSFAAGTLISVSFLHIIPHSIELNNQAPVFILAGYLSLHFFNRFLSGLVCDRYPDKLYSFGLIPAIAIGFHSLVDGFIFAITFAVSTYTGILPAVGMVLHEFPEGVVTYLFLLKGGFSKRQSIGIALVAAALTTPLGAIIAYPFVSSLGREPLGSLLGLTSGALVYVGATHLLPQTEREPKKFSLLAMLTGVMVAILIVKTHHQ